MEETELRSEDRRGRSHTPWERSRRPEITDHQSQEGLHRSGHYITGQVWKHLAKRGSDGAKTKPFLLPKQTGELSTKIYSPLLLLRSLMSRESLGLSFSAHKVPHQKMWMVSGCLLKGNIPSQEPTVHPASSITVPKGAGQGRSQTHCHRGAPKRNCRSPPTEAIFRKTSLFLGLSPKVPRDKILRTHWGKRLDSPSVTRSPLGPPQPPSPAFPTHCLS